MNLLEHFLSVIMRKRNQTFFFQIDGPVSAGCFAASTLGLSTPVLSVMSPQQCLADCLGADKEMRFAFVGGNQCACAKEVAEDMVSIFKIALLIIFARNGLFRTNTRR